MSELARNTLRSWGEGLVWVSRGGTSRCELGLRLLAVGEWRETSVALEFEGGGSWVFEHVVRADVSPHEVILHEADGQITRLARLVLPHELQHALHIGQWASRDLGLDTMATPFARSATPSPSRRRPRNIVVWVEFAAQSRLAVWWACASFANASVWVAPLSQRGDATDEIATFARAPTLMAAAAHLRRLSAKQIAGFAANWRAWAAGHPRFAPVAVDAPNHPWLGAVPQPLFDLFARRLASGLHLAPFDVQVLQMLGPEWRSSLAALRLLLRGDSRLMHVWGDLRICRRIHDWSRWQRGRFVEHRPSQSDQAFSGLEYRLTLAGSELLNRMTCLDDAPPLTIGAFRSYTAGSWLMTERGVFRRSALSTRR